MYTVRKAIKKGDKAHQSILQSTEIMKIPEQISCVSLFSTSTIK